MRILDCKNEVCQAITEDAPKLLDILCDDCSQHFSAVRAHLERIGIEYVIDPRIVRGLDYYTKTAFEFKAVGLGAQDSIGGGGRYDGLVEQCGGKPTPGVGIGMGLERILLVREAMGLVQSETPRHGVLIVALGERAWAEGVALAAQLRDAGIEVDLDYRQRSLRAQLRAADAEGFAHAVILGDDELDKGVATLRDMTSSEQSEVALGQLIPALGGA